MRVALQVQAETCEAPLTFSLLRFNRNVLLTIPAQTRPGLTLRLALENSSAVKET